MTKYNDSIARGDEKAERPDCGSPRPVMRLGNGGFTLAELMVVIGITGFLAVIAIPNYIKMLPHLRLKTAARDVASAMQLARNTAVAKNTLVRVTFDLNNESFLIETRVQKTPETWNAATNSPVNSGDWKDVDIYTASSGEINIGGFPNLKDGYNTNNRVVFRPDGTAYMPTVYSQQALYLKSKTDANEKYRVTVIPFSGMVGVEKR